MNIKRLIICIVCYPVLAFSGKVVSIHDGDTITILQNKQQIKVRLFGIDAPEKKQPYGQKSKQFLSNLIAGRSVEIQEKGKDRYKRVLGIVYLDGQDINEQMVLNGYAWAYVKYSKIYAGQELKARSQNLGLWQDKKPITPWEWRKGSKF